MALADKAVNAPATNYVRGVLRALSNAGFEVSGLDAALFGGIPPGAVLRSSPVLEA